MPDAVARPTPDFPTRLRALGYSGLDEAVVAAAERAVAALWHPHDEDIEAIVDEAFAQASPRVALVTLEVRSGSDHHAEAQVVLEVDGRRVDAAGKGAGAVHAAFSAIRNAAPHDAALGRFEVGASMRGVEAVALARISLEHHGRIVEGHGEDEDTVVAAARAFVHALNKLASKAEARRSVSAAFLTG